MEYEDFELRIEHREGQEYTVYASSPLAGEASGTFTFPFDDDQLAVVHRIIDRAVGRSVRAVPEATPELERMQEFGEGLYRALFHDDVQTCYVQSYRAVHEQGRGLRVKLRLDPNLVHLPWEFMYDPRARDYMALSATTLLVRYTELGQPITPLTVSPPLHILVVIASPVGFVVLDVEREKERINSALAELLERGVVEVDFVEGPDTIGQLMRRRRVRDYHVLHFIGHGDYSETLEMGVLMMEDERGRGRLVSGLELARVLRGHRSLQLVVVNACEGAQTSSADPFAGVAAAVVGEGIPAVVAMQFEISDQAAITFAREFYSALADNLPVDAAVTEARLAVTFSRRDSVEWATPVLFMRSPDGVLFDLPKAAPVEPPRLPVSPPAEKVARKPLPAWLWMVVGGVIVTLAAIVLVTSGLVGDGPELEAPTAEEVETTERASFHEGFLEREEENWVDAWPIISHEQGGSGAYNPISTAPWRTKVIYESPNPDEGIYQVRANVEGDRVRFVFMGKDEKQNQIVLYECFEGEKAKVIEIIPYRYGSGYVFDSPNNLVIRGGNQLYYFIDADFTGRRYQLGSGLSSEPDDFFITTEYWKTWYESPNGKYEVVVASGDIRLELVNVDSGDYTVLLQQPYEGDWSIGQVTWRSDSKAFFFDNTGAAACIWQYDLSKHTLSKIIPEHEAVKPFYFQIGSTDYVAYIENNVVKVATP